MLANCPGPQTSHESAASLLLKVPVGLQMGLGGVANRKPAGA